MSAVLEAGDAVLSTLLAPFSAVTSTLVSCLAALPLAEWLAMVVTLSCVFLLVWRDLDSAAIMRDQCDPYTSSTHIQTLPTPPSSRTLGSPAKQGAAGRGAGGRRKSIRALFGGRGSDQGAPKESPAPEAGERPKPRRREGGRVRGGGRRGSRQGGRGDDDGLIEEGRGERREFISEDRADSVDAVDGSMKLRRYSVDKEGERLAREGHEKASKGRHRSLSSKRRKERQPDTPARSMLGVRESGCGDSRTSLLPPAGGDRVEDEDDRSWEDSQRQGSGWDERDAVGETGGSWRGKGDRGGVGWGAGERGRAGYHDDHDSHEEESYQESGRNGEYRGRYSDEEEGEERWGDARREGRWVDAAREAWEEEEALYERSLSEEGDGGHGGGHRGGLGRGLGAEPGGAEGGGGGRGEDDARLVLLEQDNECFRALNETLIDEIAELKEELGRLRASPGESKEQLALTFAPPSPLTVPTASVLLATPTSVLNATPPGDPVAASAADDVIAPRVPPQGASSTLAPPTEAVQMRDFPRATFQVICVGDSGVGKTSFIRQLCHSEFTDTFHATMGIGFKMLCADAVVAIAMFYADAEVDCVHTGVDFAMKSLLVDGRHVMLQMWDTAGQERYRSLTQQYLRKADAILVVYDVTSETSFKNVRHWMTSIEDGAMGDPVLMLLGNKRDLVKDASSGRVVTKLHGAQLATEYRALFHESSARSAEGMYDAVNELSSKLLRRLDGPANEMPRPASFQPIRVSQTKYRSPNTTCCGR